MDGSSYRAKTRDERRVSANHLNALEAASRTGEDRHATARHTERVGDYAHELVVGGVLHGGCANAHEQSAISHTCDARLARSRNHPHCERHAVAQKIDLHRETR
jgi:hypothetical protein